MARGPIQRDITINLVALRGLNGGAHTDDLRKYLLGLSILAATSDIDLFLREGCNLRYADKLDHWYYVPRRGDKERVDLVSDKAKGVARTYAESAYETFRDMWAAIEWPNGALQDDGTLEVNFDLSAAKELLGKTTDDEGEGSS